MLLGCAAAKQTLGAPEALKADQLPNFCNNVALSATAGVEHPINAKLAARTVRRISPSPIPEQRRQPYYSLRPLTRIGPLAAISAKYCLGPRHGALIGAA